MRATAASNTAADGGLGRHTTRSSALGPAPRPLALIILGGINELTADLIESGGDLRLGAEIATATTTALLATNFASRGNPAG